MMTPEERTTLAALRPLRPPPARAHRPASLEIIARARSAELRDPEPSPHTIGGRP